MNNKTLGYVVFNIDYVDVLHNIRVIYVLNYTRNVIDFLCIPNTIKHFMLIFKVSTKHRKIRWFSRKYSLKNDKFSRKCVWRNKHSVSLNESNDVYENYGSLIINFFGYQSEIAWRFYRTQKWMCHMLAVGELITPTLRTCFGWRLLYINFVSDGPLKFF